MVDAPAFRDDGDVVEISHTTAAWTGPIAVLALVLLMTIATIAAFELMQSLPIVALGGHAGH